MAVRLALVNQNYEPPSTPSGGVLAAVSADYERSGTAAVSALVQQLEHGQQILRTLVRTYPVVQVALRALRRTHARLLRPLRVATMGEINAGKTALANLLIGARALPSLPVSNTTFPTLVRYGPRPSVWAVAANGRRQQVSLATVATLGRIQSLDVELPLPCLRFLEVADLPGLADPHNEDIDFDEAARHIDLAIWCTVGTQAWKESEDAVWSGMPAHLRQRGLLVATHKDLLRPGEEEKLAARLRKEAGHQFRAILTLATLQASEAEHLPPGSGTERWISSGAESLKCELAGLVYGVHAKRVDTATRIAERITRRALACVQASG